MEFANVHRLADFTERLVGLELENQLLDAVGRALSFERMQNVWQNFVRLGWELRIDPVLGVIKGLEKSFDGKSVSLSSDCSAGNVEMALPPMATVNEAEQLRQAVFRDILHVTAEDGLRLCALGMNPGYLGTLDTLRVQATLYQAFERMGGSGYFNNGVMMPVSANQTGVSVRLSEAVAAVNGITAVSGLVVALCANAAISEWQPLPWKEWRVLAWDFRFVGRKPGFERLTGFPERPFGSLAEYYRYYWQLPNMILPPIREGGWVIPDEKLPLLDYLERKRAMAGRDLQGNPVELVPSISDLNLGLICMWPFARLHLVVDESRVSLADFTATLWAGGLEEYLEGRLCNSYLECRAAATTPVGEEATVPALFLGLVNNLEELGDLAARYEWSVWRSLVYQAAQHGLQAEIEGQPVTPLIEELFEIAKRGLASRGKGEESFLEPLRQRMTDGRCPADKALAALAQGRETLLDYATYHS